MTTPPNRKDLIRVRGWTAAEWLSVDPVLANREPGIAVDTRVLKIGNGVDPWSVLPAWNAGGGGSAFPLTEDADGGGFGILNLNRLDAVERGGGVGTETVTVNDGAFVAGYVYADSGSTASVVAASGSFAQGFVHNNRAAGVSRIVAGGYGSFATGYVYGYGENDVGVITAQGAGSFAVGYVYADGEIDARDGCIAGGVIYESGNISALGYGAFAFGYAYNGTIETSTKGAFAFGYASGNTIEATAPNSVQFGPGTNDEELSLRVGEGIWLLGAEGPPTTPQDGMIWVDNGGNVVIRSGGVSVVIA